MDAPQTSNTPMYSGVLFVSRKSAAVRVKSITQNRSSAVTIQIRSTTPGVPNGTSPEPHHHRERNHDRHDATRRELLHFCSNIVQQQTLVRIQSYFKNNGMNHVTTARRSPTVRAVMSASDRSSNNLPPSSPFFLGEDPYRQSERHNPHSMTTTPANSRPSTSGGSMSNPFSPPPSVRNSDVQLDSSSSGNSSPQPRHVHSGSSGHRPKASSVSIASEPFPRQNVTIVDRTDPTRGASYYGHGYRPSRASSGARLRESFAAPPSRPVTAYSTAPSVATTNAKGKRLKSTLLEDPSTLQKPWLEKKDPYGRLAYLLTYAIASLGIIASVARCYFGYKSVPMIKGNLCMVLDEEFNTDTDTVFGSGSNWFREVELGGYG